jgi:hypothetical protein
MQNPTPTDEDRERVRYAIEHPGEIMEDLLVRFEARQRVRRERDERRRRRLNRFSLGLLARD